MATHESSISEFKSENRLVSSVPVRQQTGLHSDLSEGFFQMDEELEETNNPDEGPSRVECRQVEGRRSRRHLPAGRGGRRRTIWPPRRRLRTLAVRSPITDTSNGPPSSLTPTAKQSFAPGSSAPRNIMGGREPRMMDGEEEVIPLDKLEKNLEQLGANSDEAEVAYSLREQTMLKNMQLLSLSVQPEDAPDRMWRQNREFEEERRRRVSILAPDEDDDVNPLPRDRVRSEAAGMAIGARTYAGAGGGVAQFPQSVAGHPLSVHKPRILRPNGPRKFQGDRLPMNPRM
ncbi:hypothetical protein M3Y99_00869800 [Aphelenchoides fujianensis]|nr:hypothetical protein M3Y99_00869800 [Aphelenchoides fujianensis]